MRLSEPSGKEVINMGDGSRLGIIDECELVFDQSSGKIHSMLMPRRSRFLQFLDRNYATVQWKAIKRIGEELIIVDMEGTMEYSV